MLEAALVTFFCQRHQNTERVRVRIEYGKCSYPQPNYVRSTIDGQQHLKSLMVGRLTSEDTIIKALREHFPDGSIVLVEA